MKSADIVTYKSTPAFSSNQEVQAATEYWEEQAKEGRKFDSGKPRWGLLPWRALEEVVQVLTMGAAKYEANNWQKVEHNRYIDALLRHLNAYMQGEDFDPESGRHHLAHMACNSLFLLWQCIVSPDNTNKTGA